MKRYEKRYKYVQLGLIVMSILYTISYIHSLIHATNQLRTILLGCAYILSIIIIWRANTDRYQKDQLLDTSSLSEVLIDYLDHMYIKKCHDYPDLYRIIFEEGKYYVVDRHSLSKIYMFYKYPRENHTL